MPIEEKAGFCALCRSRCGTINVFEDGRFVQVKPAPGHPTGVAVCPKGRAAPEIVHSARRLTHPLRRTQPKGAPDPGWTRISWDEALTEIADRLVRYRDETGAESVAFAVTSQSSSSISDSTDWLQRFIRLYGSPNHCMAVEICNWHKDYAHAFTFGVGLPSPDYLNAELIVLWGHDPANSWLAQASAIGVARNRGAKLIVIDPHKSGSATGADLWCRIRPGTDGALALGVAALLIESEKFNRDFVQRWTNAPYLVREDTGRFLRGKDLNWPDEECYVSWCLETGLPKPAHSDKNPAALRGVFKVAAGSQHLKCRPAFDLYADCCRSFTPEKVAKICQIPAEDVRRIADWYASAKSVCYYAWTGIAQHTNATQTERAVATLHALTGSFDSAGGNVVFTKHPARRVNDISLMPEAQRKKALGLDKRPLGPPTNGWITSHDLYDAILDEKPYRIRALIGFGSNILMSHPDPLRSQAALQALDFQVHCDLFLNPTAETADIVLPVNSLWERESLRVGFEISQEAEELIQFRQRMMPSQGESRSDMEIIFDLACRVGLSEQFFDGSLDAGWNYVLQDTGVTVDALHQRPEGIRLPLKQNYRKYETRGFETDTGKAEIYSELFLRHGYSPVPHFVFPSETPSEQFPYVLTTGNRGNFCHSQHRGIASLRRRTPNPEVRLHPDAADRAGLVDGDWAILKSRIGRANMCVRVDDAVHPNVIVADYGFWQACDDLGLSGSRPGDPNGYNYNNLISNAECDPVSGALALRSFTCDLEPGVRGAWSGFTKLIVKERRKETDDVVSLALGHPDDAPLAPFLPGQYLTLQVFGQTRSYSLTGAREASPRRYEIAIRDVGPVSRRLVSEIAVGDDILARPAQGIFALPLRNEFPVVLVAAGIGITPFISLLRSLSGTRGEPEVTLYYSSRDEKSQAFRSELDEIASRLPNLTFINHMTAPHPRDRYDRHGRITAASIDERLIQRRARFYMCGPDEMMRSMTSGLRERGVMKFEIFQELFQSPVTTVPMDHASFQVKFARSNQTLNWTPQSGTLLSCAESAGIVLQNGCRVGQCESCAVPVISGQIRHLVTVAGAEDGDCLTCQAIPASDLVLDA